MATRKRVPGVSRSRVLSMRAHEILRTQDFGVLPFAETGCASRGVEALPRRCADDRVPPGHDRAIVANCQAAAVHPAASSADTPRLRSQPGPASNMHSMSKLRTQLLSVAL